MKKQHYIRQQQEKRFAEQVTAKLEKYKNSDSYIVTMPDETESFTYTYNGQTYVRLSAEMFKEWRNAMIILKSAAEIINNEQSMKELTPTQRTFVRYILSCMPRISQFDELCKALPIW